MLWLLVVIGMIVCCLLLCGFGLVCMRFGELVVDWWFGCFVVYVCYWCLFLCVALVCGFVMLGGVGLDVLLLLVCYCCCVCYFGLIVLDRTRIGCRLCAYN